MSHQPCLPELSKKERKRISHKQDVHEKVTQISDICEISAMKYLALVKSEARRMPDIFTMPVDRNDLGPHENLIEDKFSKKDKLNIGTCASIEHLFSHRTSLPPFPPSEDASSSPHPFLPRSGNVDMWIDAVLSDFSSLRDYLQRYHEAGVGRTRKFQNLPPIKDAFGWNEFCLGKNESQGNLNDYFQDFDCCDDESDDYSKHSEIVGNDSCPHVGFDCNKIEGDDADHESEKMVTPAKNDDGGHAPTAQLLLQMDQVMTRAVLSHHSYFLCEKWEATVTRMSWIYALLARIEKPLHRDDLAMMRSLLKVCCTRRWNLYTDYVKCKKVNEFKGNSDFSSGCCSIQGLNVVIVIIGIFFEQGKREDIIAK